MKKIGTILLLFLLVGYSIALGTAEYGVPIQGEPIMKMDVSLPKYESVLR